MLEFNSGDDIKMYNKPYTANDVDVYLDEPIRELSYYRNLLHYMRQMEEHDELRLWISSPGGYLSSTLEIVDAMNNSEGKVMCIVTGEAHSGASIIALSAPHLIVGDNATMMCHTASYGIDFSKQGNIESMVEHSKKQIDKIVRKAYKHFLSESEIELMLTGKDYWFDSDEIKERLEKRQAILVAEHKKAEKAAKSKSKSKTQGLVSGSVNE
jgi:ATP-dependent protease ClpP protease subunit